MKADKISQRAHRKDEHLALAKANYQLQHQNSFDQIKLVRPTLPETVIDQHNIQTTFLGHTVSAPFFINAMTGGSPKGTQINRDLGTIAAKTGIPIALGSANIVTHEPEAIASFVVAREENPTGVILANINPFTAVTTAKKLEQEIKPDAFQIHLNAVQELIMPEGDRDFRWLDKLLALKDAIAVPVIIKEVGFGFDLSSLQLLEQNGFEFVDVAGSGGTDFAWIENFRRPGRNMDYLGEVGISTVDSLLNAGQTNLTYFASGGVRNPLDVLKSLVLGARAVGISNRFLQEYEEFGSAGLLELINNWQEQLAGLIALYGANSLEDVKEIKYNYKQIV